jgi:hypothetical protein
VRTQGLKMCPWTPVQPPGSAAYDTQGTRARLGLAWPSAPKFTPSFPHINLVWMLLINSENVNAGGIGFNLKLYLFMLVHRKMSFVH